MRRCMFNLLFKKKVNSCDVEMEITGIDESNITKKAEAESARAYNQAIKNKIRDDLISKYKINLNHVMASCIYSYEDTLLIAAIIQDMADSCGLLKEVPNDK